MPARRLADAGRVEWSSDRHAAQHGAGGTAHGWIAERAAIGLREERRRLEKRRRDLVRAGLDRHAHLETLAELVAVGVYRTRAALDVEHLDARAVQKKIE